MDLFDRIARKRAVCFLNCDDSFMLRNGITGSGGWHNVGCDDDVNNEKYATLGIDSYMTYDEIMISAMCGISSQTQFINDGARKNCGKAQDKNVDEKSNYNGKDTNNIVANNKNI